MPARPNILFLMADQMRADVLAPDHPCRTPRLDRLASRGLRITRAYTPNPICSPARASLITGLLPHNHGVLTVTHCVDADQSRLRTDRPHWAQRLSRAGYHTGYFGKWHVERSNALHHFGWRDHCVQGSDAFAAFMRCQPADTPSTQGPEIACRIETPGYKPGLLYAVTDKPAAQRPVGAITALASRWLDDALKRQEPWCAFVSVPEPHDPFTASRAIYEQINVDAIELPGNVADDLADKPGLYRRAAAIFRDLTPRQKRQAVACYWAAVTEIDAHFGSLIERVAWAGQLDRTIIVLTSDHGECLGAHGLYMKNVGAFEEAYNIPMTIAGPGVARAAATDARVGLHDLCPTLCELAGVEPITNADSRSAAALLADPARREADWRRGYAEYHGTRQLLTQRVAWDGPWKLVHNGFDFDELYNLDDDPGERRNRAADPACADVLRRMMALAWSSMKRTGDHTLVNTQYPVLRLATVGPTTQQ